jgi:hypothetical protein
VDKKQPKAKAAFNEDGTQVTITVEGQEGAKTFKTKLSALNYGSELLDSGTVDEDSLWKARKSILDAKNLENGTKEEIDKAREALIKDLISNFPFGLGSVFGTPGGIISVIEIGVKGPNRKNEDKIPIPMEKPIFEMCECGQHGKIVDEAGKSDGYSNDLGSQEHAKSWVKFGIEEGILKPQQEADLLVQIEASSLFKTDKERVEKMKQHK